MEFEDITYFLTKLAKIAVHWSLTITILSFFCHLCKIYVQILLKPCFFPFLIRRCLSFLDISYLKFYHYGIKTFYGVNPSALVINYRANMHVFTLYIPFSNANTDLALTQFTHMFNQIKHAFFASYWKYSKRTFW